MTLSLVKALLIINAKKGWSDEARAKALLKRKKKAEVSGEKIPSALKGVKVTKVEHSSSGTVKVHLANGGWNQFFPGDPLHKKFGGKSPQVNPIPAKSSGPTKKKSLTQLDKELNSPETLSRVKLPTVRYHVTSKLNQDSIAKTGLKKSKKTSTEGKQLGSYLIDKAGLAELQRGGGSDLNRKGGLTVFEVKTKGLKLRLDPEFWDGSDLNSYVKSLNSGETTKSMYSQASIPPSKLKLSKLKVL